MTAVAKYERTKDVRKMLTSAQLAEAIIREVKRQFAKQEPETNILDLLQARTATSMRFEAGATTAIVWDEGGTEEKIKLPLEHGWRKSDGNPFGIPNGKRCNLYDPEAFYFVREYGCSFNGPVGFGYGGWNRKFDIGGGWIHESGMALVDQSQKLRENAAQLRQIAEKLRKRFKGRNKALSEIVKPIFENAARLIEVAEAIEQARK